MDVPTIIAPNTSNPIHVGKTLYDDDLLWSVELEKDEELWMEAHYLPTGLVRTGRVRYTGKVLRGTNSGSNEKVAIPSFEAIGENNPLIAGEVRKYRLWRS